MPESAYKPEVIRADAHTFVDYSQITANSETGPVFIRCTRVYNLVVRRLLSIATIAIATVFLFAASMPASAQMRGGGRGAAGGHGGGFAGRGGFSGHMGGDHAFGGMHSGPGFGTRGFNRGNSFRQPAFRGDRFRPNRFRDDRFRDRRFHGFGFRRCFGCRGWGGSPWWYAGYYDPYWWWDSGSSYDEDRAHEIELASEMNAQSLAEQRMRREQDQDLYARSDPPPQRETQPTEAQAPATILVFRDERKQEVQNYAVVGQTLWIFEPQRTEKIPLSQLDIPATAKANDEHGVDFRIPGFGEGQ